MSLVASGPIGLERVELTVSVCASIQFVAGRVGDMACECVSLETALGLHLRRVSLGRRVRAAVHAFRCMHGWRRVGLVSYAGRGAVAVVS